MLPARALAVLLAPMVLAVLPVPPALAGRPLETEDAGTLEPGHAEVELSGDFAHLAGEQTWGAKVVFAMGLLRGLEARVESTLVVVDPPGGSARAGAGDSLLGVKYRLLDEAAAWPAALVALTLRLPTGDPSRGLGADGADVGLTAVATRTLGPVVVNGNAGYTVVTSDRDADFWTLAASVEYAAAAAWSVVAEAVATLSASEPDGAVLRAGGVWTLSPRVRLDSAVGVGLTPASPDLTVTIGVTLGPF